MSDWKRICGLEEIPKQGSRVVKQTDGGDIAIFRTANDEVFALRDRCPHKGGPLSQGIVHGQRVACPLHGWNVKLASGEAVAPDAGSCGRFAVRVEAGDIYLQL